jgi:hypothetical protein
MIEIIRIEILAHFILFYFISFHFRTFSNWISATSDIVGSLILKKQNKKERHLMENNLIIAKMVKGNYYNILGRFICTKK